MLEYLHIVLYCMQSVHIIAVLQFTLAIMSSVNGSTLKRLG